MDSKEQRQWALPTHDITVFQVCVPDDYFLYASTVAPCPGLLNHDYLRVLHPTPYDIPPPEPFTYPRGQTLTLTPDNGYRARYVYDFAHTRPLNSREEIEALATVRVPPSASPEWDDTSRSYILKPLENMTPLIPGIPVRVRLDGNDDDAVTVAALFDLPSLASYPEYPKIKQYSDKLWDITWGLDGGTPLYKIDGLLRNMRSAQLNPLYPWDGSSSLASTKLEGNGDGDGRPATQANSPDAVSRRLLLLETLSHIYWVMAPLAMSKREFEIITFRTTDMNIFSFGGLLPTGLTGLQQNVASAWQGGELSGFIGLLQGSFHVDVHDDPCRWTMLVIQIWIPPGSDPGAFLLARWGLYARTEVDASGQVRLFLWFKGNDLHSGIAPSVHPSVRQDFLDELAQTFNKQDEVNRVVHVCYPTEALTHCSVPMATFPPTSFDFPNTVNPHYYATEGVPALGNKYSLTCRLSWDSYMQDWNRDLSQGLVPAPPLTPITKCVQATDDHGSSKLVTYQIPLPSFFYNNQWITLNPVDNMTEFAFWRGLWKQHDALSNRYLLKMTKYDYRFGQERAMKDYMESSASGVVALSQFCNAIVKIPATVAVATNNTRPSYPSIRKAPGKRRAEHELEASHPSKQSRRITLNSAVHASPPGVPVISSIAESPTSPSSHADVLRQRSEDNPMDTEPDFTRAEGRKTVTRQSSECDSTGEPELCEDEREEQEQPSEEPQEEDEEEIPPEEVSFIVGYRRNPKTHREEFRIRWSGYDKSWDSWTEKTDIDDCVNLIEEYFSRMKNVVEESAIRSRQTLYRIFQLDVSKDIDRYKTFDATLPKRSPATSVQDVVRNSKQLQEIGIHLESSIDFYSAIAASVVPSLSLAASVVMNGSKFSVEEGARTFVLNQAVGRAYLFAYNWYTDYGPALVTSLITPFHSHSLDSKYPTLAPITSLVMTTMQNTLSALKRDRRPFKSLSKNERTLEIPVSAITPLLPQHKQPFIIDLPPLHYRTSADDLDYLVKDVVLELLSQVLLLQPAAAVPTGSSRQLTKSDWIIRGAVVDVIIDTFDDDSILGYQNVHDALKSSWTLLGRDKPQSAMNEILENSLRCTADLRRWLAHQPRLPDVQENARHLANYTQSIVTKLTNLSIRSVKRTHGRNPKGPVISLGDTLVTSDTPLRDLCPYEDRPMLGFISVMLRDVLAFARHQPSYLDPLRRILMCADLKTSSTTTTKNPDHYSPIRKSAHFQSLYTASLISPHHLTSTFGLSNILLRFATGQSYRTQQFLEEYLTRWFMSAEECVAVFETVRKENSHKSKKQQMQFTDGGCWGQYTWVLDLKDTKKVKRSIRDRITPLFSRAVCDQWRTYCGQYFNVDHTTIPTSSLPPYESVFELLDTLKVSGFGAGSVTRMQFANYFALIGLCAPPSIECMGRLGYQLRKGALNGLMVLGFDVRHAKEAQVIRAFKCVYDFLDSYLSLDDKTVLGFGAIFVEHLLCKVIRWYNVLYKAGLIGVIMEILKEAREGHDWRLDAFPCPLWADRSELLASIDRSCTRV